MSSGSKLPCIRCEKNRLENCWAYSIAIPKRARNTKIKKTFMNLLFEKISEKNVAAKKIK
jgi:hypothetical protein